MFGLFWTRFQYLLWQLLHWNLLVSFLNLCYNTILIDLKEPCSNKIWIVPLQSRKQFCINSWFINIMAAIRSSAWYYFQNYFPISDKKWEHKHFEYLDKVSNVAQKRMTTRNGSRPDEISKRMTKGCWKADNEVTRWQVTCCQTSDIHHITVVLKVNLIKVKERENKSRPFCRST